MSSSPSSTSARIPADSIADVGAFLERRAGGFVIADRLLPRIRSYGEDGRLEAAFGRFGDGPFEFRQVSSLAETPSGEVVVADSRRSALFYLTPGLRPDTMVSVPGTPRRIVSFGPDLIVRMDQFAARGPSRLVAKPPLFHRLTGGRVAWSAYPARFSLAERPYWGSFATNLVAVAGDSIFVMTSLTYPITVIDAAGDSVGTMGKPSESFRPIPVFDRGNSPVLRRLCQTRWRALMSSAVSTYWPVPVSSSRTAATTTPILVLRCAELTPHSISTTGTRAPNSTRMCPCRNGRRSLAEVGFSTCS